MPWGAKLLRSLRGEPERAPEPAPAPRAEPEVAAPVTEAPPPPEPTLSEDAAAALLTEGVRAFEAGTHGRTP